MSVFHLVFFRCHSVSPKWGFHKRFRCPITLPNRLAQLDVLLLCNHIVHYIRLSFRFQSPLPRGERQGIPCDQSKHRTISIRAPARGATAVLTKPTIFGIFQSALPRGERLPTVSPPIPLPHFNPRSREGSDDDRMLQSYCLQYFNPRSREGSDRSGGISCYIIHDFNPRSREGSDPNLVHSVHTVHDFNPRSREGSDTTARSFSISKHLFQSALPRGERPKHIISHISMIVISIRAPARGAT